MKQPPESAGAVTSRSPSVLGLAVGLGCVVNPLNGTMIAMGFADIARAFGHSLAEATWLITLYLAATAAMQPVAGALGDRLGRRGAYLAGLAAFAAASAGAALATTFPALVTFRCLQAIFSAVVIPNGQALLREGVPASALGRTLGTVGAVIGLGAALGLPLGGWIVEHFGWRALFWLNLPVSAAALALGSAVVPRSRPSRPRLSPVAAVGAMLVPLTIGLQLVVSAPSRRASTPFFIATAVLLTGTGVLITRSAQGRGDLARLGNRWFLGAAAMVALQNVAFYSLLLMLPPWLQGSLGLEHGQVGLLLGGTMVLMTVLTPLAGRMVDRRGASLPARLGFAAIVACLAVMAWPAAGQSLPRVVAGLALFGAGMGLSQPAVQRQALDAAPEEATAMAMGLFASARYLGGIVGAALLTTGVVKGVGVDFAPGVAILRNLLYFGALPALFVAVLFSAPPRQP